MRAVLVLVLLFPFLISAVAQEKDPLAGRDEWSIVSYSFPTPALVQGFTSRERGQLRAPSLPVEGASVEAQDAFLKKSHQIVGHFLEQEGVSLPEGSLVTFDAESMTLVARVPGLTHWSLRTMAESLEDEIAQFITLQGVLLETPSKPLLDLIPKATSLLDHAEILAALKQSPGTEILQTIQMDGRSGQSFKSSAETEIIRPDDWQSQSAGFTRYERFEESSGTTWAVSPTVGPDGETVDTRLEMNCPLAPAQEVEEVMAEWQGKTMVAVHRNQFPASIASDLTFRQGTTKLVGIWPSSQDGRLQSAFLAVHLVRTVPLQSARLLRMVEERGEAVQPTPPGKPKFFEKQVEGIPEGMFVQRFRIPPSFLTAGGGGSPASLSGDPFANVNPEPRFTIRATAMDILKSVGVQFPPGSSANYLEATSELIVRNTPESLDLVSAYVSSLKEDVAKSVILTATVFEAPSKVILALSDQMLRLPDHREALETLRGAAHTKLLSAAWIESRSGQLATVSAEKEFHYVSRVDVQSGPEKPGDPNRGEEFSFETEKVMWGTSLEVTPLIGPDGATIDVSVVLEFDYAPPLWQGSAPKAADRVVFSGPQLRRFRQELDSNLILRSGTTRMLGYWKPEGKENAGDVLQVAFIRATLLSLGEPIEGERVPAK
jgi:hypothetical protein